MPFRHIGRAFTKLNELRRGTNLPGAIDRRLGNSLSAIKKLPQMPLRERKDEARKQRDALADVRTLINDVLNQATYNASSNIPTPDVIAALDAAISALGDIAEGAADVAGNIDFNA
jgi:hypothetical protein